MPHAVLCFCCSCMPRSLLFVILMPCSFEQMSGITQRVHTQNSPIGFTLRSLAARHVSHCRSGQAHGACCPAARLAHDGDLTPQHPAETLADRQAESAAAILSRPRHVCLRELDEELR